jgi:hypothetical protein
MNETIDKNAVAVNSFVLRQTKESPYSYYAGDLDAVALEVSRRLILGEGRPGYRDGVMLVSLHPKDFYTSIVELNEGTLLGATFEARRPDEAKHVVVRAHGPKVPARAVEIVLYRRDVLEEKERSGPVAYEEHIGGEGGAANMGNRNRGTDIFAGWEMISINARATEQEEPMDPLTMARNFLVKTGGTKGVYSAEQFAESIWYWSQRALSSGE